MTSKSTKQYEEVLTALKNAVTQYGRIMCDFEQSILKAVRRVYEGVTLNCCLFHLGQSSYKKIQEESLQVAYNDKDERSIKEFTHVILALAYVPPDDVPAAFAELSDAVPDELLGVTDYFSRIYVWQKGKRP